ncbi:hypothetical protein LCGC14_1347830 [marine sediment metagenome]|uniref:Uncharacterized protein n=1 Tax=marine sediment metagenome TaxID=412755 RepID=A0A0F9KBV1_9ZZZZ
MKIIGDCREYVQKLKIFEAEQPELYATITKFVESDDYAFTESTFMEIAQAYKVK